MAVPLRAHADAVYCAVICAVRLMGKRQIGELDPSELVVTILVSPIWRPCPCRISGFRCSPVWCRSPRSWCSRFCSASPHSRAADSGGC